MDRSVPSEAILQEMRRAGAADLPSGRHAQATIKQHEKRWQDLPWQSLRDSVE
jgi:hypothetical protein